MQGDKHDIMFIRHAESMTNAATQSFVNRSNIVYDWDHLSKNQQFLTEVKYNPQLIDAYLTPLGQQQCQQASLVAQLYQPDLILVSPLNRTLLTCHGLFSKANCPIIVLPLLAQGLRSSCDFSGPLAPKKEAFSSYDFSLVDQIGPYWFIHNESQTNQTYYWNLIEQHQQKDHHQVLGAVMKDLTQSFVYETPANLRERTTRLKEVLKEYRKSYQRIAVVTHYNIIRYTLAKEFDEKDHPIFDHIENCAMRGAVVHEL